MAEATNITRACEYARATLFYSGQKRLQSCTYVWRDLDDYLDMYTMHVPSMTMRALVQ